MLTIFDRFQIIIFFFFFFSIFKTKKKKKVDERASRPTMEIGFPFFFSRFSII